MRSIILWAPRSLGLTAVCVDTDFVRFFCFLGSLLPLRCAASCCVPKVNLTSTKLDHISLPEELPALMKTGGGFT